MRTLDEARNYFAYHPATKETAETFDYIREGFLTLVAQLWDALPDGPDKTVALRALHVAQMQAIAAVAVSQSPADWVTPHVARVLPYETASSDGSAWTS